MSSIAVGAITPIIVGNMVKTEMLSQTVHSSTSSIYNNIASLLVNPNFYFSNILEQLDIETKLKIILDFINNIKESSLTTYNKLALNSIYEIIKKIEIEIDIIHENINKHNDKWFHYIRYCNNEQHILNLNNFVKILDERFDLFMKLIF
jgi:hypothetical protein